MDYLSMEKDIFYSVINMKLRDFYTDINDFCISEGLDIIAIENKIKSYGLIYDKNLNRLMEI